MKTMITHVSEVPAIRSDPPDGWIKGEKFRGNVEARLGQAVGLTQFGVNHVTLAPGNWSSLRHWHEGEDEFVTVLEGELTLVDENGAHVMRAGSCVGFPAGAANAHHLQNRSDRLATFIAVGTRKVGRETVHYPDETLGTQTVMRDAAGKRTA